MKRLIASRKLKRQCLYCNKEFNKGEVYYKNRDISVEDYYNKVWGNEYLICPKCKHKREQQEKRFNKFRKICTHPKEFIKTEYGYIPGECVMQPEYEYCQLCGEIIC